MSVASWYESKSSHKDNLKITVNDSASKQGHIALHLLISPPPSRLMNDDKCRRIPRDISFTVSSVMQETPSSALMAWAKLVATTPNLKVPFFFFFDTAGKFVSRNACREGSKIPAHSLNGFILATETECKNASDVSRNTPSETLLMLLSASSLLTKF